LFPVERVDARHTSMFTSALVFFRRFLNTRFVKSSKLSMSPRSVTKKKKEKKPMASIRSAAVFDFTVGRIQIYCTFLSLGIFRVGSRRYGILLIFLYAKDTEKRNEIALVRINHR